MAPAGASQLNKALDGPNQSGHASPGKGLAAGKGNASILPPVNVRLPKAFSPSSFGHGAAKRVHPEPETQSPTGKEPNLESPSSEVEGKHSDNSVHEEKSGHAFGRPQRLPSLQRVGSKGARTSIEEASQSPTLFSSPPLPASPNTASAAFQRKADEADKLRFDPRHTGTFPPRPSAWLLFSNNKNCQEEVGSDKKGADAGQTENGAAQNGAHLPLELFDDPGQDLVHPEVYIREVSGGDRMHWRPQIN
jgi:hypothetical protein